MKKEKQEKTINLRGAMLRKVSSEEIILRTNTPGSSRYIKTLVTVYHEDNDWVKPESFSTGSLGLANVFGYFQMETDSPLYNEEDAPLFVYEELTPEEIALFEELGGD